MSEKINPDPIRLRIVFFGTPKFARQSLQKLLDEQWNVVAVVTQAEEKTKNNRSISLSPVKQLAESKNIPILQPKKLDEHFISQLTELKPDIIVVSAYGKILPKSILSLPGFGCVNVHGSLLPKYRGASPIQNALLNGEQQTGITIMLMNEKMDEGPIISQKRIPIDPEETCAQLFDRMSRIGAETLTTTLHLWIDRKIEEVPQNNAQATYCQLIEKEDGHIYWNTSAEHIYNMYRAFYPWPGIFTFWKSEKRVLRVKFTKIRKNSLPNSKDRHIGEVFMDSESVCVQTRNGSIIIEELQLEGKKNIPVKEFLLGYKTFLGSVLL